MWRPTPDFLAVHARFESGFILSANIDSGRPGDTPFIFQVIGTNGQLSLRGGHPYGFQAGELHLEATVPFAAAEPPAVPELRGVLANIGGLYQHFARDIRTGENTSPSFGHALKLHKLIRSIGIAADSGIRQTSGDWPTE